MLEVDLTLVVSLLTVAALAYFLASLVPRVDAMDRGYRKFLSLTTLGISYVILLGLLLTILVESIEGDSVGLVLSLAVGAFVLFSLTFLWDVFDDWLRLFGDPEFNTLVEASMVLAVLIILLVFLWLIP